jgi:hypothetical protein
MNGFCITDFPFAVLNVFFKIGVSHGFAKDESNESLIKLKNDLSKENLSFFVDCFCQLVTFLKKAITASEVISDISKLPYFF